VKGTDKSKLTLQPVLYLVVGFFAASFIFYGVVSVLGRLATSGVASSTLLVVVAVGCSIILALDLGVAGLRVPTLRRQTPKRYMDMYRPNTASLLWGLDTGLVLTTIRISGLSWAAILVTFVGGAPWWVGCGYAVGFTLPLLVLTAVVPIRDDSAEAMSREPTWLVLKVERGMPLLRGAARTALAGAAVLSVATLLRS
jgi:hypothetical protein